MSSKYIYSIFIPAWRIDQAKKAIKDFIKTDITRDIELIGIDECYIKSYINRDRTICEVCITSKTAYDFDELWHSPFGKMLRTDLGYTLKQVQRGGICGIYKRPDTYKFSTIQQRLPKRKFLAF